MEFYQIKPGGHYGLSAVLKNGKVKEIRPQVLRKLKFPDYQKKLYEKSLSIVCNYTFQDKTRGWNKNIKAICHPFREDKLSIFPDNIDLWKLSESDFVDEIWIEAHRGRRRDKYDFCIFTIDTEQGIKCKGYHAVPLILQAANEMGLHGFLLDYYPTTMIKATPNPKEKYSLAHQLTKTRKKLARCKNVEIECGTRNQKQLSKIIRTSRFVIFPNNKDASPRMIPETIIRGTLLLVNKNIYGGWKYITKTNGMFFDSPPSMRELDEKPDYYKEEFKKALGHMMDTKWNPTHIIDEYYSDYGFFRAAGKLAKVVNKVEGHDDYKFVFYRNFAPLMAQWRKLKR